MVCQRQSKLLRYVISNSFKIKNYLPHEEISLLVVGSAAMTSAKLTFVVSQTETASVFAVETVGWSCFVPHNILFCTYLHMSTGFLVHV